MDDLINTTPQKALQLLCSCPSPDDDIDIIEQRRIFLSYLRFIIISLPDASVEGIWEELLWNTLKYSRDFIYVNFWDAQYVEKPGVDTWLCMALSCSMKCPNPYIRLELFRLVRLFKLSLKLSQIGWDIFCTLFIHTIVQIQPHFVNEQLFRAVDLHYILLKCYSVRNILPKIISIELVKQYGNNNEITVNSIEVKFIVQCMQLLGRFAYATVSNPNPEMRTTEILNCLRVLYNSFLQLFVYRKFDYHNKAYEMSLWNHKPHILSRQPFHNHVAQAFRDITMAVTHLSPSLGETMRDLMFAKDTISRKLHMHTKRIGLPKLLLGRQLHDHLLLQQYSLLLCGLGTNRIYKNMEFTDEDDSDDEDGHIHSNWILDEFNPPSVKINGELVFCSEDSSDELSDIDVSIDEHMVFDSESPDSDTSEN